MDLSRCASKVEPLGVVHARSPQLPPPRQRLLTFLDHLVLGTSQRLPQSKSPHGLPIPSGFVGPPRSTSSPQASCPASSVSTCRFRGANEHRQILAAGLVVAGLAGDPSMRGPTGREATAKGSYLQPGCPHPQRATVHLPLRAVVGAIAILAFGRRAFAGAVFTSHMSLLVHCLNRMTQVLSELLDIGLRSLLSHTLPVSLFSATGPLRSMALDVRSASCARSEHPHSPLVRVARRRFPQPSARSTPCRPHRKGGVPLSRLGVRASDVSGVIEV